MEQKNMNTNGEMTNAMTAEQYKQAYCAAYKIGSFKDEMSKRARQQPILTGFNHFDLILGGGLYPGLFMFGAQTGAGKTTLVMQMADAMAAAGRDILIFSLEMSTEELVARSVCRETYQATCSTVAASCIRDIMDYGRTISAEKKEAQDEAWKRYDKYAGRVFIREGMGDIGTAEIRNQIWEHIDNTSNTPIVIVDYLQILAPQSERMSDKQAADKNILELKRISRDFNTPVICVSSLNRMSYSNYQSKKELAIDDSAKSATKPVTREAFKESGAIEYSCDMLLGLSAEGVEDGNHRQTIVLQVLKNRRGGCYATTRFTYHKRHFYFEPWPNNGINQFPPKEDGRTA